MSTDKLIPISYVRKFTTLAKGDVIFSKSGGEYTISSRNSGYNRPYDGDNNIFVVSFAPRLNTGTQPVGDDVSTNALFDGEWIYGSRACIYGWHLDEGITKWKPNHAAMLKQFKEQGASTMNTDSKNNHIAITIEALGSQPVHHIDLAVTAGALQDVRIGSPVEPYEWTEKHDEQLKSAMVRVEQLNKPVFTQEMKEAGQHLVGMSYMDGDDYQCELVGIHHDYFVGKIIGYKGVHPNHLSVFDSDGCKPIDNRTDDQKCFDDLNKVPRIFINDVNNLISDIKADKITGVKWVGK